MRAGHVVHRPVVNAFLVRERDRRRFVDLFVVIVIAGPVALALLAYAWIHLQVVREGYQIGILEHRLERLLEEERSARLEAARLASPGAIERRAGELGLGPPGMEQVLFAAEEP